jgi:hypothetical protein
VTLSPTPTVTATRSPTPVPTATVPPLCNFVDQNLMQCCLQISGAQVAGRKFPANLSHGQILKACVQTLFGRFIPTPTATSTP